MNVNSHRQRPWFFAALGALNVIALTLAALPAAARPAPLPSTALAALSAKKAKERSAALRTLGATKNPRARLFIEKRLTDKSPDVRAAACDALARLGDARATPALERATRDKAPYVARRADAALATLSGGDAAGPPPLVVEMPVDTTGKIGRRLREQLQHGVASAIRADPKLKVRVVRGPARRGYAVQIRLRDVKRRKQGAMQIVTVRCEMTLVALPGRGLRMQSSTTAGGGMDGKLTARVEQSLLADGVKQCIPEIASDVSDYVIARAARRP